MITNLKFCNEGYAYVANFSSSRFLFKKHISEADSVSIIRWKHETYYSVGSARWSQSLSLDRRVLVTVHQTTRRHIPEDSNIARIIVGCVVSEST
jgi:hypothetical protein